MKRRIAPFLMSLTIAVTHTGSVAGGGMTGGATEITQLMNNSQLIVSYTQQVQSYVRQGLQLQAELKNLINNPTSLLGPEIGQIINNIGTVWKGANSIGYNLAQIDKNFETMFKSSKAGDFSKMFTSWHKTNTSTLEAGLKAIGVIRENQQAGQNSLTELYNRSQNTNGNLDSLQTLSQINIRQIQELQQLQELMGSQFQAIMTYMATKNAKDEKNLEDYDGITQPITASDVPKVSTSAAPKWKGFGK